MTDQSYGETMTNPTVPAFLKCDNVPDRAGVPAFQNIVIFEAGSLGAREGMVGSMFFGQLQFLALSYIRLS